jgi:hypothetical protein
MPPEESFEEKVVRLLELILKRLIEIERQVSPPRDSPDYGDPI